MDTLNKVKEFVSNKEKDSIIYFRNNDENLMLYKENTIIEIEELINQNYFKKAEILLNEYKCKIGFDVNYYSIKGIIRLSEGMLNEAYNSFSKGLGIDNENIDLIYNMIYTSALLNKEQDVVYYKNKLLTLTNNISLIRELDELISNKLYQNYTIITIGVKNDDKVLECFYETQHEIIDIVEKDNLEYETKYYKNGITVYEVSNIKYYETIEYIIRRNKNCVVLFSDFSKIKLLEAIKEDVTLIYYPKINYYQYNKYSINKNYLLFNEKEISNLSDIIITSNVNIYNYKKIIEGRNNIYLVDYRIDDTFNLKFILDNYEILDNNKINNKIRNYGKNVEKEYDQYMYIIASEINNLENVYEILTKIYIKYNTQDIYNIYIFLLSKFKDFINLIDIAVNSEYCDDVYKSELIYLKSINDDDLIEFIANISINNYIVFDKISEKNYEYKMALYYLIINKFEISYSRYIKILSEEFEVMNSPLVNRNIAYLMYLGDNDKYIIFYNIYRGILEKLKTI